MDLVLHYGEVMLPLTQLRHLFTPHRCALRFWRLDFVGLGQGFGVGV